MITRKIAARYINSAKAEKEAFKDQTKRLPKDTGSDLYKLFVDFEEGKTKEGQLAKECDWLEQAFTAKEYYDLGYKGCMDWIKNIEKVLTFTTTKALLQEIKKTDFNVWHKGLKKLPKGPYHHKKHGKKGR